jgi:hypothetical protein
VADYPFIPPSELATVFASVLDRERKIDRVLETLGPVAGRDVVLVDPGAGESARWQAAGARLTAVGSLLEDGGPSLADGSADAILSAWSGSAFRGVEPAELAAADRVLRPDGRLLVVHDYGRDDVSRLRGDLPEYGAWSRRNGPFLGNGFRMRVVHCFWTFDTLEDAQAFLGGAFGQDGLALGRELKRPRLSYNVAVYHRTRGGLRADDGAAASA